ncbi:MAG: magnesium transporter CorA family protein [Candidatus Woesebacteria bacterium]|jgi:magnesium transporter
MIKYYNKPTLDTKLNKIKGYITNSWVSIDAPSAENIAFIEDNFQVDGQFITEALDTGAMPQLTKNNELVYACLRYPHKSSNETTTKPIVFIIGKNILITITKNPTDIYDDFVNEKINFTTSDPSELGLLIFDKIIREYEKNVNQIGRTVEKIRQKLRGQVILDKDFVDFVVIEGELNEFETILGSMGATLKSITDAKRIKNSAEYQDLSKSIATAAERTLTNCKLYEKSISSIRDAYSTLSSNKLNQTMKVLTIATLFVALPTSVYSMYGMNVALPFADQSWAFAFLVLLSLCMPLAIIMVAVRKKLL